MPASLLDVARSDTDNHPETAAQNHSSQDIVWMVIIDHPTPPASVRAGRVMGEPMPVAGYHLDIAQTGRGVFDTLRDMMRGQPAAITTG